MTPPRPAALNTAANQAVLAHLENLSAHSDIAGVLTAAVKSLGDAQLYCPDWRAYRYVVASTKGVIFGFAVGMDTIAFRLDERMRARALLTGGIAYPDCGDEWVAVLHRRPDADWPAVDVRFWALQAYASARNR